MNACGYWDCTFQTLSMIDGATLAVTNIGTWYGSYDTSPALAVNPVTNKVFVVNAGGD